MQSDAKQPIGTEKIMFFSPPHKTKLNQFFHEYLTDQLKMFIRF